MLLPVIVDVFNDCHFYFSTKIGSSMADLQYFSKLKFKTNIITHAWSVTVHVSSVVQVPDCIAHIFA